MNTPRTFILGFPGKIGIAVVRACVHFDPPGGVLSVAAISEPSSALLLTAGLMTILFLRRRPSKNL